MVNTAIAIAVDDIWVLFLQSILSLYLVVDLRFYNSFDCNKCDRVFAVFNAIIFSTDLCTWFTGSILHHCILRKDRFERLQGFLCLIVPVATNEATNDHLILG